MRLRPSLHRFRPALVSAALVLATAAGCATHTPRQAESSRATGQNTRADWKAPEVQGQKPSGPFAVIGGKVAPVPDVRMGDRATVNRIIDIGTRDNRVMDHLEHLTLAIGPRLTGSTRLETANRWAVDQFASYGLEARLDQWGTIPVRFDRGESTGRVVQPGNKEADPPEPDKTARQMEFSALAWTPGTSGPLRGPVIKTPTSDEQYAQIKDTLKGAWILLPPPRETGQRGVRSPQRARWESRADSGKKVREGADPATLPLLDRMVYDGVAGFISTSRDERVWTSAVPGWRELTMDTLPITREVVVRQSDYDYLNSRLFDALPTEVEFDLKHTFSPGPIPVYNTVAMLRGTEKPDEYVIVSGHVDSWDGPGSQGCIDNATGSAVTIEAARLLMAAGAKPRRSILFILWTGEEQGLLGSTAWVEANPDKVAKTSACFVDDGGTNYQGGFGVADQMVGYLAAASAPVNAAFPTMTVNIRPTGAKIETHGSSDHAPFNRVGVPGLYWDEIGRADYGYGWHTQNDRIELAIPEYLVQSSVNSAVVAYNLACAPDLLPRVVPEEPSQSGQQNTAPAPSGGIREVAPAAR